MRSQTKIIALLLLLIHSVSVFYPGSVFALTGGPTQPESSVFQPASVSNLVDPFSGDFSYNIPLLDVDGYPVNLAYSSGGSMDDEASWVGYGWNINPGSLTRTMKGIPDDFNGTDKIHKEYNVRPDITGGISFNASFEIFGLDFLGANASTDIFYNNKRGLGIEIGAGISASLNTSKHVAGEYTAGLSAQGTLGVKSNSQTGADFNFGLNFGTDLKKKEEFNGALGLKMNGSLNSRAGLKSTTLGVSVNPAFKDENLKKLSGVLLPHLNPYGSATTQYGMSFTPTITMPMQNQSYSLSPQLGPDFWGLQVPTLQITGHYTRQKLQSSQKDFPAYGFLNLAKGTNDPNAVMDFNREKDVPYMESTPTIAVPYVTQDVFTATSQFGSSQFKASSYGSGVLFDNYNTNKSHSLAIGVEFGSGGAIKGGIDLSGSGSSTVSRKWTGNNEFLNNGDFGIPSSKDGEAAYFKLVGERSSANADYFSRIAGIEPVKVQTDDVNDDAKAFSVLQGNDKSYAVNSKIARNAREPKGELFMPLNADRAQRYAMDKKIRNYAISTTSSGVSCTNGVFGSYTDLERITTKRKAHHLSEITINKNDGTRLIYGIPVYNNEQNDVTFNVGESAMGDNLVHYLDKENSTGNKSGNDYYFSKETVPAYATSFLLNGVVSPDYVDLTGNGISDDDLGTAVKFNYSLVNDNYKWRTPAGKGLPNSNTNYANFSDGFKSQSDDNKASLSYGSKEIWYTNSIESKNMIAVFRLGDRDDGYGFNPNGTLDNTSKQKKLERIDLYTKTELITNPSNPTPIKSVHFEYDYSLFNNVPNNINGEGKLTLKSVYFTYGKNTSGSENRYYFKYNASGDYQYQQYDRWGNFKDKTWNNTYAGIDLDNNDYPYSIQNKSKADEAAAKWQLEEIELPSGGKIKVTYETDDYAFVQDKRAMQMVKIIGYGELNKFTDYQKTDKIYLKLPSASSNATVRSDFMENVDQLYFKTLIDLNNKDAKELVSGYAKVKSYRLIKNLNDDILDSETSDKLEITLEKRGSYHPVAAAAWQFLRMNLPKLAYPYSVNEDLSPLAFVKALIAAIGNVAELFTPFELKAMRMGFGSEIDPDAGYVRVTNRFMKYGGGVRVKKVIMDDIWEDMAGSGNGNTTTTGMEFSYTRNYTTAAGENLVISSGVASYEPAAGGEENPFRQPISYQQRQHLTSNIYTVEEPLGESYFPAPSVGYSQVTIRNLDAEGELVTNGYTVKKFYTARDFPTIVKRTDLSKNKYNQASIFGIFKIDQGNSVVLSQGFYVETNDMHGKALSDETFDGSGKMISGSYHRYKSKGTESLALDNNALTLRPDGTVKNEMIGVDFEMYHDMREQVTDNIGVNVNLNLDVLFLTILTIPVPTFIPIFQSNYTGYQSASTIKVVNRYAIEDKVITIDNGSTMTSENMLWDALTGQVLLTKTQNAFDDPLYNFNLPAYMVNEYERGMGAAYKNTGILFNNILVTNGQVPLSMTDYVVPGDELGISGTSTILWVMDAGTSSPDLRLIRKDGSLYDNDGSAANLILLRSGRRNLLNTSSYSVVSLKSPIQDGKINFGTSTQVLNTSASTFSDDWTSAGKYVACTNTGGPVLGGGDKSAKGKAKLRKNNNPGNKPINISDLIENQKRKNKTGVVSNAAGPACDPCNNIENYTFDYNNTTNCLTVSYTCADPFPDGKEVYFFFNSDCPGEGIKSAKIDKDHLSVTVCDLCVNHLIGWYCRDKIPCADPCDPSTYDYFITSSFTSDAICVVANYPCGVSNYPAGVTATLTFSEDCNGIITDKTIIIDKDHLYGMTCFDSFISCGTDGPQISLSSVSCSTTTTAGGCCGDPVESRVNPYYTGLKGNWRSKSAYVYYTQRDAKVDPGNTATSPTNLRKGGVFNEFTSFYKVQSAKFVKDPNDKWVATSTVTRINSKGQEIENKDALNRFSSAQFGFNDLLSTAVASNTRSNEIAYDGFEDYGFSSSCGTGSYATECNEDGHFNFKKCIKLASESGDVTISSEQAHTGNYSIKVKAAGFAGSPEAYTYRTTIATEDALDALPKYQINSLTKEMILKQGGILPGFSPALGKKYVLSGWIKGNVAIADNPSDADKCRLMVEAYDGSTATGYVAIAVKSGPKVEGWTRVMTIFELPTDQDIDNIAIKMLAGTNDAYFDDIRIHPYNGNMKSFVYDFKTSRLMAQLDENNYASFFEYNDEGQLMRTKKETEKGIVTIKETRSRIRKNSH